jgi:signal transduction histidine kinase
LDVRADEMDDACESGSNAKASELVRSERLVTLGWLAASVGHDLRTPLAAIRSNSDLVLKVVERLRGKVTPGDEVDRALQTLEELERTNLQAVDRLAEIVQGLKAFAQAERPGPRCGSASDAIDQALRLCRQEIQHVRVRVETREPIPAVAVPDAELMQVVMNLVLNAAQALPLDGEIDVSAYSEGDRVTMTVTDNGPGLDDDVLANLFKPGITTRAAQGGTGLGLSIVKRIVDTHGGRIDVASERGRGVRFRMSFPIAE